MDDNGKFTMQSIEEEEEYLPNISESTIANEFEEIEEEFEEEYNSDDFSIADNGKNIHRNRYSDVVPYDKNVIFVDGQYMNASDCDINGIKYIACQFPLLPREQLKDGFHFYNMIIQHKVRVIVNLQNTGRSGHPNYWTSKKSPNCRMENRYGAAIDVKLTKIEENSFFNTYTMLLTPIEEKVSSKPSSPSSTTTQKSPSPPPPQPPPSSQKDKSSNNPHEVSVLLYKKWPDHDVPESPKSIFELMKKADLINDRGFPIDIAGGRGKGNVRNFPKMVVHCSAGIGRTGVFMLCHNILRNQRSDNVLSMKDIPKVLSLMRKQRYGMIQTEDQYIFVYRFLNQYLKK